MPDTGPTEPDGFVSRGARVGIESARRLAGVTGLDRELELIVSDAVQAVLKSEAFNENLVRGLTSPAVEDSVMRILDSEMVDKIVAKLIESEELQLLVERIAEAPEVRAAITHQGVGLMEDLGEQVTYISNEVDDAIARITRRLLRRSPVDTGLRNAGLITRAVALGIDAAVVNVVFLAGSSVLGLAFSAIGLGETVVLLVGVAGLVGAAIAYLLVFWSLTGQTIGMRFLGLRIQAPDAPHGLGLRRAVRRLLYLILAAIPFGLGLVPVVTDSRRRGFHDRRVDTEVLIVRERSPLTIAAPQPVASG